jgi:hypothetical protein
MISRYKRQDESNSRYQLGKSVTLPADSVTCEDLNGLTVSDRYHPQALSPIGHANGTANLDLR